MVADAAPCLLIPGGYIADIDKIIVYGSGEKQPFIPLIADKKAYTGVLKFVQDAYKRFKSHADSPCGEVAIYV